MAGIAIVVEGSDCSDTGWKKYYCELMFPHWNKWRKCYVWEYSSCIMAGAPTREDAERCALTFACFLGGIVSIDAEDDEPVAEHDWRAMFGTELPSHEVANPFDPEPAPTNDGAA